MEVDRVRSLYASLPERLDRARRVFGPPRGLTETILVILAKPGKDKG